MAYFSIKQCFCTFKPTSVLSLLLEIMEIGEVDPGSHFGKTLNCSTEAEESIGNSLLNQDVLVAVFWFPPDVGVFGCLFSALWYKVKSVFLLKAHTHKWCWVQKKLPMSIVSTSLAFAWQVQRLMLFIISCCPAKGGYPGEFFWYVSFSSHSSPKMYCQNTELCQCLPAEVWTLDLKPTNQGTGKEITFVLLLKELLWASV